MRLRSVVLPAVLAVAAAVLTPTSAQAATKCALLMPTKVVIDAPEVWTDVTLTYGCYVPEQAAYANWELVYGADRIVDPVPFTSDEIDEGPYWSIPWMSSDPTGRWVLRPAGAKTVSDADLDQNSAVTTVKYGSRLATKITRTGSKLSWAVTATQWSGRANKNVARPNASVGLFHRAPGSTTWTYVKSVTTSSTGKATVSLATAKAGSYRLKVAETPTVWAALLLDRAGPSLIRATS